MGEPDHRKLGGTVGRHSGPAGLARHRGDVDDPTFASLRQFRDCRLATKEDALDVHVHGGVPLGLAGFHYRTHSDHAGIIDQDIDPAERGHGLGYHALGVSRLGDVCQHWYSSHAHSLNLTRGLLEQRFIAELIPQACFS